MTRNSTATAGNLKLIGLTGRMHSGKDTFYRAIQARALGRVHRLAFGDPLKAEVARACGVSLADIQACKTLYRPILQWWGTDFRRNIFGQEYWIVRVEEQLNALRIHRPELQAIFITDVRFPNEADFVKRQGGIVIRIVRPLLETGPEPVHQHASEAAMDRLPVDYQVLNDGCRSALEESAQVFWSQFCGLNTF